MSFARSGRRSDGMRVAWWVVMAWVGACSSVDPPGRSHLPRAPQTHRATAPTCAAKRTSAEPVLNASVTSLGCTKNADCTGLNAHCVVRGNATACAADACTTNAECPGVAVCECSPVANFCVAGGCLSDEDCGPGGYCSPSGCSPSDAPHYCHTTADECLDDSDCQGAAVCRYQASSKTWRCITTSACQ